MTTLTIPPELADRLADEARRRGTTPELLALDALRRLVAPPADNCTGGTLHDFLAGYIGTVRGSGEPLSEECGKHFTDGLVEKQQRGRL